MTGTRILALGYSDNGLQLYDSETGEVQCASKLPSVIATGSGGVLAGSNLYPPVARLNQIFGDFDNWQCQIRGIRRDLIQRDRRLVIGSFLPTFFGFRQPKRSRARSTARLFHCMDLEDICGAKGKLTLAECIAHAQSILDLCQSRNVRFTAGRGAMASRLLKASPYWERGRQAAPEFVNDFARKNLPGNHYGISVRLHENTKQAFYVDQVSAHHNVALSTPVPHPSSVRAVGFARTTESGKVGGRWLDGADATRFLAGNYGLVSGVVSVGHIPDKRKHLYPPFMHTPGRRLEFFYTNEAHYFDGVHATLEYLCAGWTSSTPDPTVPEYARWALTSRNGGVGRKPVLLAAYGALALRSDRPSTVYHAKHKRGLRTELPRAGQFYEVNRKRKEGQPQPSIVNVLARGIIEAETRARSLALARDMDARGVPVISVYVDGLILATDRLPFLPEGWEVESELTNISFQHATHFRSDEITKQPGIPQGASRKFMTPVEEMRARTDRFLCASTGKLVST